MKHFVLSSPPNPEGMIRLYGEDYHYLVHVRRLRAGLLFNAILPGGTETRIRILSTTDGILIGECLGFEKQTSSPDDDWQQLPPIELYQGVRKGSKMDLIMRQAAEGGISVIAPFQSEYSAVKINSITAEKAKRWEKIVREARQQSGSAVETKVLPSCSFQSLLDYWESKKKDAARPLGILLHQDPLAKGSFHDYLGRNPDYIALAVGPEGGFSPGEVSRFLAAGWKPLVMGNTILRTETAALYGIAAIRIILLEKKTWSAGLKE